MRKLSTLVLSTALLMPLPVLAESVVPAQITVTGTGTVEAAPDIATLQIGVTTQAATAAEALSANSAAVEEVIRRLTKAGLAAADMQTSNLSLNPNWGGDDSSSPSISGYVAMNFLTIRVRDLDRLGTILDAAVADGANTLNGLTFGLADPEPLLDEARKEAVQAARARAELLAGAAGVQLGGIVSIVEGGAMTDPMPVFRAEAASVPVAEGELGLSASVTVTFAIAE